jgi:methylmalonyl-CoA carboxyltransferase large subunit
MTEPTLTDVLAAVHEVSGRTEELSRQVESMAAQVEALEAELADVRHRLPHEEVPDEVVLAISAAVAAFLGHRARLKHVRYRTGTDAWTQHGRAAVHRRTASKGVR